MSDNKLVRIDNFRKEMDSKMVQDLLSTTMKDNASSFSASLIDIYTNESSLQECAPNLVINEALKAASLKLPISKGLGFAYIIAYKGKPQFQIGYRGYLQLAIRSGLYDTINADVVYEGELTSSDKLRGTFKFDGQRKSDKVIGYFAHIELKNGFSKTLFMTKEQVTAHAKKYSKTFSSDYSPWKTDFDAMGIKTVLKNLVNHYGTLSVEMQSAFESEVDEEITANANTQDITFTSVETIEPTPVKHEQVQEPRPQGKPLF